MAENHERTRRFIDSTVLFSLRVRCVHPRTSGPKRDSNSSPRTNTQITATQPPAPTTQYLIPWVHCPQSRCVIAVSAYTIKVGYWDTHVVVLPKHLWYTWQGVYIVVIHFLVFMYTWF